VDTEGNLYATGNGQVWRRSAKTHEMKRIAGVPNSADNPFSDADNQPATKTRMTEIGQMAFDRQGNLYLPEQRGRIRKLSGDHLEIIAGTGVDGSQGDMGPARAAWQHRPKAVAFDALGNLVVADTESHFLRVIAARNGLIFRIAGNGAMESNGDGQPSLSAAIGKPMALAFDAAGNLYFADATGHAIRQISKATGHLSTIAGQLGRKGFAGDGGPANRARLYYPDAIAFDRHGDLYIADCNNNRIRKVDMRTGIIVTVAGNGKSGDAGAGDGGDARDASIGSPTGVAVDEAGNLYIAANSAVREVTADR